ncbi:MAG: archaeal proteasome endopeptidase complex subunit beta [Candidatus Lokiarchaeota archaeon]|nr:archaeal proteasome endopeptidase complex subunit beta [Candidatus Lokiarchaeota archaeon]MBD3199427.1 archaeal proteasome endopeptidase complex subunit beta [Candidatus Lokiarchaeota archaeon]
MKNEELLKSLNSNFTDKPRNQKKVLGNPDNTFKTGTTTVGLTCKDAVILGTDKRASMAYFVASKTSEKLHRIQDHLWMTIAGSVADAQYLIDVLKAQTTIYQLERQKTIPIKSAAQLLSNILYQNKMFPYQVGLILGGVTSQEGPIVIDIGAYGSVLPEKFCAVGSGQNFSYGVLEAKYKDDLTVEEGKKIIISAIKSSIKRDMASGNGIDIAVIRETGEAERDFISIKKKP